MKIPNTSIKDPVKEKSLFPIQIMRKMQSVKINCKITVRKITYMKISLTK